MYMYLCLIFVSCIINNVYATRVLCNWTSSSCEIKKEHLSLLCSYKSTRLHEKREDMMTYDMIYLYVCDESQEELRVSREARNVRALQ